mmetsp:Transcript_9237/g.17387  ORF Transcript_9237/g.17387 Transcript_9237/m.17387 type:complete len:100 (-) Transcript_9237:6015-6314(-)
MIVSATKMYFVLSLSCSLSPSLALDGCPLVRNRHKISLHSSNKSGLVQRWLDNSGGFASNDHGDRFPNSLHLFQDIILAHEVNNAYHKLVLFFIDTNKD